MTEPQRWSGRLLVATPELTEPHFARTVLLLLQHSAEDGALGVVLNRPSRTDLGEVLPDWASLAQPPAVVFEGGPVQPTAAICLGRSRQVPPSAAFAVLHETPTGTLGTVDLDAVPADLDASVEGIRVFAGYAGWSPGQLEDEVAEGSWWVLDALPGDPFTDAPTVLWRQVLRRQGMPLALVASYPPDPTLN
jgi:putative transcriptional regulator